MVNLAATVLTLAHEWEFCCENRSLCLQNVSIPNQSHLHLFQANLIEDPYKKENEILYQWIARENWTYRTQFTGSFSNLRVEIEGIASIYINEVFIARVVNSFMPFEFDIAKATQFGKNDLKFVFESPLTYASTKEKEYPYPLHAPEFYNTWTEPAHRNFIRLAAASFGWDWGPAFVPVGLYNVELYHIERLDWDIRNARVIQKHSAHVELTVEMELELPQISAVRIRILVSLNSAPLQWFTILLKENEQRTVRPLRLKDMIVTEPRLWYPAGYGEPYLYDFRVQIFRDGESHAIRTVDMKLGLRVAELITKYDDEKREGEPFYVRINNIPVFSKGANYIPPDAFATRVTPDRIRYLLTSVLASNMNMIRVWGGGRYESDFFYQECDRLGILVWQEFMFACATYPRDDSFLSNVSAEVRFQVNRLRNHASVVIWGGNNENEIMVGESRDRNVAVVDFVKLYIDTIYTIVKEIDSNSEKVLSRGFVDSSPSNGVLSKDPYVKRWGSPNDPLYGDVHFYDYFSNCQDPDSYAKARFVSEFGFQSVPSESELKTVSDATDWSSYSSFIKMLEFRERHSGGLEQIQSQISQHFQFTFPADDKKAQCVYKDEKHSMQAMIYLSQIQQALCYETAIQKWRRDRNIDDSHTMGILYWQLNDIWPGMSWSSIEYSGHWKSLQYLAKRAFAPVALSAVEKRGKLNVYVVNDQNSDVTFVLMYKLYDLRNGRLLHDLKIPVSAKAQTSAKIHESSIVPTFMQAVSSASERFIVLSCEGGDAAEPICPRVFYFFTSFKDAALGNPSVQIRSINMDTESIYSSSQRYVVVLEALVSVALFVVLEARDHLGFWSDNAFHLIPNEPRTVYFHAFGKKSDINFFREHLDMYWLQKFNGGAAVCEHTKR